MIAFIITLGEIMWSLRLERSRLFYLASHNEWHCVRYTTVDFKWGKVPIKRN